MSTRTRYQLCGPLTDVELLEVHAGHVSVLVAVMDGP